jgi:hypothetical protein
MASKSFRLAAGMAGLALVLGLAAPVASAPAALASVADPCPAASSTGGTTCNLLLSSATSSEPLPNSYGPVQIAEAYGLDASNQNSTGSTPFTGREGELQTVAVIGAGTDPTAIDDLTNYRAEYGLPPCTEADGCLRIVNEAGEPDQPGQSGTPPPEDAGFTQDESVALEMVSAACPNCRLLAVEANAGDMTDIGTSVDEAVTLGASVINEPITGDEFNGETADDTYFDHPGVEITVPAGQVGYGSDGFAYSGGTAAVQYPAASPYVTAVGGTNLDQAGSSACTTAQAGSRGWCEEAWLSTISGCSQYEPAPVWQINPATGETYTGCSGRAVADVGAVATSTAAGEYPMAVTYGCTTASGCTDWMGAGETAVASAIVAGVYADAGPPATASSCDPTSSAAGCPAAYPYDNPGISDIIPGITYPYFAGLNGITTDYLGNGYTVSSQCTGTITQQCEAGPGWNGITGVGTPQGVTSFASTGTETGYVDGWGYASSECIDNASGKLSNGNEIENNTCNDSANQESWTFEDNGQIELGSTGDCLGISGADTAAGSKAVLWSCSGDPANQQWRVTGWGQLLEDNSGKCLDIPGIGSQLEIEPCEDNDEFSYVAPFDLPAATGEITSQGYSGQCLTNASGKLADANAIGTSACTGSTDAQEWTLEPNGNIQIDGSGYCLSLDSSGSVGELEQCYTSHSEGQQQWIVQSNGTLYVNGSVGGDQTGVPNCLYGSDNDGQTVIAQCEDTAGYTWNAP